MLEMVAEAYEWLVRMWKDCSSIPDSWKCKSLAPNPQNTSELLRQDFPPITLTEVMRKL